MISSIQYDGTRDHLPWMWPGKYPRTVKRMLMRRSGPQPATRKTPTGGRKIVMMMSRIAEIIVAVVCSCFFRRVWVSCALAVGCCLLVDLRAETARAGACRSSVDDISTAFA
jgi:hypothetical protein